MKTQTELKEIVKQKYSEIALESGESASGCCGSGCCTSESINVMADDYSKLEGYNPDADLGLGCGLPTEFAKIKPGDIVVDLGSGAGNDVFVARQETGEQGKVIGIDFSDAMLERARINNSVRGFNNVEFIQGDIESIPLESDYADVIVSNCVLNLVPDKNAVLKEIFRVLKPGGHFSISDIVLLEDLPSQLQQAAEMYAGCVSGAIHKLEYLSLIEKNGFKEVAVQKEKPILLPAEVLSDYLNAEEAADFNKTGTGIFSITVYAEKPAAKECCNSNCCN